MSNQRPESTLSKTQISRLGFKTRPGRVSQQPQPRMRLQFAAMLLFFLYSNENLLQRRSGRERNQSEFTVCDGRSDAVKAAIASHVIASFFLLHNCTAALMASADLTRGSGSRGVGALMTLQIKEDERGGCASAPPRSRRRPCWECRLKNAPFQKRLRRRKKPPNNTAMKNW